MNSSPRLSVASRAILALLLTIGFYGLAIGIALGLLYLIYVEVAVIGRINVRLTIFALIGAVVIIWSILPRIDNFTAPGPRLTRKRFPALFNEIERIAKQTQQEMPRDIYLVPDVNAFVAERGGFMGFGRRRVMGIGLPLFHLMTVDQLSSVLAHEFGHYYGGDTALGPWIYKTREAIIRTTVNVGQTNQWLYILFEAYAKMFLRVTNAVSRQQEYLADKLAARIVGSNATISGLQMVHKYGYAFNVFFQREYAPVIEAGFKPPMLEGFQTFLSSPKITEAVDNSYEQQLTQGVTNPYDSHPSLKERISALKNIPAAPATNDSPASSLLPPNTDLETPILRHIIKQKEKLNSLKPIDWDDVIETAFAPNWNKNIERFKPVISTITPQGLFDEAQNSTRLFEKLATTGKLLAPNIKPSQVPPADQLQFINSVIGTALSAALRQDGWDIRSTLGEDLVFIKNGREIKPHTLFSKLAAKEYSRDEWIEYCDENNLSDLRFT